MGDFREIISRIVIVFVERSTCRNVYFVRFKIGSAVNCDRAIAEIRTFSAARWTVLRFARNDLERLKQCCYVLSFGSLLSFGAARRRVFVRS